jgi:methionyl-tRNA formyltransferase
MNRVNIALFYNNKRGLEVLKYFLKKKQKKYFIIKKIFLSKKNLIKNVFLKTKKFYPVIIDKVNSKFVEKEIKKKEIDIILVCGFPYIFKKNIFDLPKIASLNLHGGPLPKYRGGSPLNWQIINNEKFIGISVIKIDEGIDTGPIIVQKKFKLNLNDDINSVHNKANKIFPIIAKKAIIEIKKKNLIKSQIKKEGTYFPQRSRKDGKINFDKASSIETFNLIRAITKPYPGAFCYDKNGKEVIIYKSKICKNSKNKKIGEVDFTKKFPVVKFKKGSLKILKSSRQLINNELLS